MKLLNELTVRNFKLNKKRTIVTMIGIFLSTFLVSLVVGMGSSLLKSLEINGIEEMGNYHIYISNVRKEEFSKLSENREVDSSFYFSEIGVSLLSKENLNDNFQESKPYLEIVGFSENAKENFPIHVQEGRLPSKEGEILLTPEFLRILKEPIKVGDTLLLKVGKRVDLNKHPLSKSDSLELSIKMDDGTYTTVLKDYSNLEKIIDAEEKEYTIVGIADIEEMYLGYQSQVPYYTIYTVISNPQEYSDVYMLLKHPRKYDKTLNQLVNTLTSNVPCEENNWCSQTYYNSMVLNFMLDSIGSGEGVAIILFFVFILSVVVASSIVTIRNSFCISISERCREFGMLSSVGATPKQLFQSVLLEGFFLGIFSIPIGLLLGSSSVYGLVNFLNTSFNDFTATPFFHFYLPPWTFLLMIFSIFLVIFFSAFIPARLVSKMTVLDAIRGTSKDQFQKKKLKVPRIFSRLFKAGGEIAYKNMKRSKKKYKTTVLSIVVSVSVFIAMFHSIHIFYTVSTAYLQGIRYDIHGDFHEVSKLEIGEVMKKLSTYLKENELVDDYSITAIDAFTLSNKELWDDTLLKQTAGVPIVYLLKVENQEFQNLLHQLGEKENLEGAILIDDIIFQDRKKAYFLNALKVKDGDIIEINDDDDTIKKIKILKRSTIHPLSLPEGHLREMGAYLVMSEQYFDTLDISSEMNYYAHDFYIKTNDASTLIEKMKKNADFYEDDVFLFFMDNCTEQRKIADTTKFVVSFLLYGFIGVVALIGVTSVFNTITTNMNLRAREFAMLEAIGMTKKEFHHMICLESIFIGLKSLVLGILLGLIFSYLLHGLLIEGYEMVYQIPWLAIFLSILFVFVIITIIMHYSIHKIQKQNIMETIREENI